MPAPSRHSAALAAGGSITALDGLSGEVVEAFLFQSVRETEAVLESALAARDAAVARLEKFRSSRTVEQAPLMEPEDDLISLNEAADVAKAPSVDAMRKMLDRHEEFKVYRGVRVYVRFSNIWVLYPKAKRIEWLQYLTIRRAAYRKAAQGRTLHRDMGPA
jgi:hypothetical protein